jgi:hypothetical protein
VPGGGDGQLCWPWEVEARVGRLEEQIAVNDAEWEGKLQAEKAAHERQQEEAMAKIREAQCRVQSPHFVASCCDCWPGGVLISPPVSPQPWFSLGRSWSMPQRPMSRRWRP